MPSRGLGLPCPQPERGAPAALAGAQSTSRPTAFATSRRALTPPGIFGQRGSISRAPRKGRGLERWGRQEEGSRLGARGLDVPNLCGAHWNSLVKGAQNSTWSSRPRHGRWGPGAASGGGQHPGCSRRTGVETPPILEVFGAQVFVVSPKHVFSRDGLNVSRHGRRVFLLSP